MSCPVQPGATQYGMMIDAGSSGSRIYIYTWAPRSSPDSTPPSPGVTQLENGSWKVKPGISSFSSNPSSVGTQIKNLLAKVTARLSSLGLTSEQMSMMPIYLKATAGMRVLPPATSSEIMKNIRLTLRQSPFCFPTDTNARVISGEEEGAFGWLGTNYLLGTLQNLPSSTFGAMDMGGASTQITFSPSEETLASFFPIYMNKKMFPLYTHSYLYFGVDQLQLRLNEAVIAAAPGVTTLTHPCFNIGYNKSYTSVATKLSYTFVGSSDYAACRAFQLPLLLLNSPCMYPSRCSIQGEYQPNLGEMNFVAFSVFSQIFEKTLLLPQKVWFYRK